MAGQHSDSIQVFNASLHRTKTASIGLALDQLGFGKFYSGSHFRKWKLRQRELQQWYNAAQGISVDFTQLLAGHQSVGMAWSAGWKQIIEQFPEAKVLLVLRDPDDWYDSMMATSYSEHNELRGLATLEYPGNRDCPDILNFGDAVCDITYDSLFGDRIHDRSHTIDIYHKHNQAIQDGVDSARLLVQEYDKVSEWQPLCNFLGKPIPETPFPAVVADVDSRYPEYTRTLRWWGTDYPRS